MVRPMPVPRISAKITAGIFSIRTIELIPIPMEQSPKIIFRLVMIRSLIKFRAKRPIKPPTKMHNALMMIPMGIDKNLLSKKYWYSLAHFLENSKGKCLDSYNFVSCLFLEARKIYTFLYEIKKEGVP